MSDRRSFIRSLALLLGGAAIAPKLMAEESVAPPKNSGGVLKKLLSDPVQLGISDRGYGLERAPFNPRKGLKSRYGSEALKGPLPNWPIE